MKYFEQDNVFLIEDIKNNLNSQRGNIPWGKIAEISKDGKAWFHKLSLTKSTNPNYRPQTPEPWTVRGYKFEIHKNPNLNTGEPGFYIWCTKSPE